MKAQLDDYQQNSESIKFLLPINLKINDEYLETTNLFHYVRFSIIGSQKSKDKNTYKQLLPLLFSAPSHLANNRGKYRYMMLPYQQMYCVHTPAIITVASSR